MRLCPASNQYTDVNAGINRLFINDQDQLRQIENPEERFEYYVHGKSNGYVYEKKQAAPSREKERMNERRREAVDGKQWQFLGTLRFTPRRF